MSTVELPIVNGVDGTWLGGGMAQACMSPRTAAGMPADEHRRDARSDDGPAVDGRVADPRTPVASPVLS